MTLHSHGECHPGRDAGDSEHGSHIDSVVEGEVSPAPTACSRCRVVSRLGPQLFPSREDSTTAGPDVHLSARLVNPRAQAPRFELGSPPDVTGGLDGMPAAPE